MTVREFNMDMLGIWSIRRFDAVNDELGVRHASQRAARRR